MRNIRVIYREHQEAIAVHRLLKACNPEPFLI